MRATDVLSSLAAVAALAAPVLAQQDNSSDNSSPSATASASNSSSSNASPSASSNNGKTSTPSPSSTPGPPPLSSSSPTPSQSATPTSPSSGGPPTLVSSQPSASNSGVPAGLPTLTQTGAIPTYPAPSVPPTNNAPFMKQSSAPDGTVFIAVGAILGAFGVGILLWRAIVSFLLHRSVRRAALAQHDVNSKAAFPAPPAPFYKYTDQASPVGSPTSRRVGRGVRGSAVPASNPSQSNLFFSPTAAASSSGPGARGSTFLPSGFYAAGSSSPGGQNGPSISLTNLANLRPDSVGHGNGSRHTLDPTPPDSPHFPPRRDLSTSSVNLSAHLPGQRAPSAYLDDLLADDPGSLPPQMPPSSGPRHSNPGGNGSPRGRF